MLTKVFILLLLWWLWRLARVFMRNRSRSSTRRRPTDRQRASSRAGTDQSNLTDQEISDADYEEIP